MKKIILIVPFLLAFAGFGFAQTNPKDAKTTKTTTTKTTTKTTAAGPLKKDGTPDMRYKANKDAKTTTTTTTHLKKDGTQDKRYKENKAKKGS